MVGSAAVLGSSRSLPTVLAGSAVLEGVGIGDVLAFPSKPESLLVLISLFLWATTTSYGDSFPFGCYLDLGYL